MSLLKRASNLVKGAVAVSRKEASQGHDVDIEQELAARKEQDQRTLKRARRPSRKNDSPPPRQSELSRGEDLPPKKRTL